MATEPTTDGEATTFSASTSSDGAADELLSGQPHLLVFEGDSSYVFTLPTAGAIVIGRGKVDLRLANSLVSRRHARVALGARAVVEDLGSQNGTRLNGEKLVAPHELAPGDIITIGPATLAFHSGAATGSASPVIGFAELRHRLDEELDRALRNRRDFAVLGIELGVEDLDRDEVERALADNHRQGDLATWAGASELLMLLAETSSDGVVHAAKRLVRAFTPLAPQLRIGYAVCPLDGCDADTLLARARTATLAATPGEIGAPPASIRTIEIGDTSLIVADKAMARLYGMLQRIAASDLPVLVYGETGTGKELAARAVHVKSPRSAKPMVTLNCAALQVTLVESELFGHAKGAFSGAVAAKPGLFETASGGTVFLDEIGELSLTIQAKLLRALETKRITRVGEVREREVDIRLVAATNRDLKAEVAEGQFREDLFFRLSGATLTLPPLRERLSELPLLADKFLNEACERGGRPAMTISPAARTAMLEHSWPGNVRELKNLMDYVAAAFTDSTLKAHHIEDRLETDPEPEADEATVAGHEQTREFRNLAEELRELEIQRIREALEATSGNHTKAAKLLGMPVRTFFYKIKKFDLGKG